MSTQIPDAPGSDFDVMRDVYMTPSQRAAFDRIAAEIVRLRGEVSPKYDRELIARMLEEHASEERPAHTAGAIREQARLLRAADNADAAGVHTATLAPAEAKGDVLCRECGQSTMHEGTLCYACSHPQPAGGEAVAPAVDFERFRKAVGCMRFTAQALRGMAKAAMDQEANALDALIDRLVTTPPAAQGSEVSRMDAIVAAYNTWPDDLRKKLSIHDLRRMTGWTPPAAQVQECHMRGRCECIGACKYGLGGNGAALECPACRLEAALQHRGDSRGGEG